MVPERVVRFRARTVLTVLGIVLAVAALLKLLWIAHQVLTWVVIAVFLALALDPLVNLFIRLGIRRRGLAIAATFFLLAIVAFALGATFIPTLVGEINDFIDGPQYVKDLTEAAAGSALERDYQIVERVQDAAAKIEISRISACPAPPSP